MKQNRGKFFFIFIAFFSGIFLLTGMNPVFAENGPGSGFPGASGSITAKDGGDLSDALDSEIPINSVSSKMPAPAPNVTSRKNRQIIPAASPEVFSENSQGLYSIKFKDKEFYFRGSPLKKSGGHYFVNASDPDFASLFGAMGITYSWYSFSGKFFVYLPQGSVNWNTPDNYATVGNKRVDLPIGADKNSGAGYLPLESIASILDLKIIERGTRLEIRPKLRILAQKSTDENTYDFVISSASVMPCDVKYQSNPSAVRFTIPGVVYDEASRKLSYEGVDVKVNDKIDPGKVFVTLEFPKHWRGAVVPSGHKNQVTVRMKPNLVYDWGTSDETVDSVDVKPDGKKMSIQIGASGKVKYFYKHNQEEGMLYIDIPFSSPAKSLSAFSSGNVKVTSLSSEGVNFTRIQMKLEQDCSFAFGSPQKNGIALMTGPSDEIASPSVADSPDESFDMAATGSRVIVLDPGHGGCDPGACNSSLGLREKDITLDISKKLASALVKMGWKVALTRTTDTDVTYAYSPDLEELQARASVANKRKAALFVSIHCNASTSKSLRGSSYHWYKGIDKMPADMLRGSLGSKIGTVDKGTSRDSFYVLRHTKVPAVLVETAFISNPSDARILASSSGRQNIAEQLARSIDLFLQSSNLANRPATGTGGGEE